jgi:hypothetical protein
MNNYKISEFPTEVIDQMGYYVYRLIDPRNGETFYVGKGKGNRVFQHIKCALSADDSDELNDKLQTIREINNSGLDVIHVIHRHGLDKGNVLEVEAALIDAYTGITNIMGGHGSNEYGPMNAYEVINKYAAEEVIFEHKVLMITINRSINNTSVYDATRFAWRIDKNKAERADLVFGVEKGIVVGVFVAEEWKKATPHQFPEFNKYVNGRWGFSGQEADSNIKEMYLRKRIPDSYRKKGASNPIKYSYQ